MAVPWASQTPHNPTEATSQTDFIKNRVRRHQGSSPTPILSAVDQFAKGAIAIMHKVTLLRAEVKTLREANSSLSKRRKAKKTRIREGGTLSIGEAQDLLDQNDVDTQLKEETRRRGGYVTRLEPRTQRCGICGTTGHNARTCKIDVEISRKSGSY